MSIFETLYHLIMRSSRLLLCIGFVYPEPKSSAAGSRILQLLKCFLAANYRIIFASTAKISKHSFDLNFIGIETVEIQLNDSKFDDYVKTISPSVVLFDRFMTEEQFGWRISEHCPEALRILDTEDLHFLRKSRSKQKDLSVHFSKTFLKSDLAMREIASLYRCDLTLVISEFEFGVLTQELSIPKELLMYIPFILNPESLDKLNLLPLFKKRKNFVFVGNFMHPPNLSAVSLLKEVIWPEIRNQLPGTELHIYGAYAKPKDLALENSDQGFFIHGRTEDLDGVLQSHRLMLAPLQFGAGLKGKVLDAMRNGIPCVLTTIAAEGIFGSTEPNGFIEDSLDNFIDKAVQLYNNKPYWKSAQQSGFKTLSIRFSSSLFETVFIQRIHDILNKLQLHRLENITGLLLEYHQNKSTKYFSKWIEEKNKRIN